MKITQLEYVKNYIKSMGVVSNYDLEKWALIQSSQPGGIPLAPGSATRHARTLAKKPFCLIKHKTSENGAENSHIWVWVGKDVQKEPENVPERDSVPYIAESEAIEQLELIK